MLDSKSIVKVIFLVIIQKNIFPGRVSILGANKTFFAEAKKITRLLSVLLAAAIFLGGGGLQALSTHASAEGSSDITDNGGDRAYMEYGNQ